MRRYSKRKFGGFRSSREATFLNRQLFGAPIVSINLDLEPLRVVARTLRSVPEARNPRRERYR
jgi:hypothetical protein